MRSKSPRTITQTLEPTQESERPPKCREDRNQRVRDSPVGPPHMYRHRSKTLSSVLVFYDSRSRPCDSDGVKRLRSLFRSDLRSHPFICGGDLPYPEGSVNVSSVYLPPHFLPSMKNVNYIVLLYSCEDILKYL